MTSIVDVCQAVADEIHAVTRQDDWEGEVVTATRAWVRDINSYADERLIATVAPTTKAVADETRGLGRSDIELTVKFSKRLSLTSDDVANNAQVDPLARTVELLQEFFSDGHRITGLGVNVRCGDDAAFEIGSGILETERLANENFFWSDLVIQVKAWE